MRVLFKTTKSEWFGHASVKATFQTTEILFYSHFFSLKKIETHYWRFKLDQLKTIATLTIRHSYLYQQSPLEIDELIAVHPGVNVTGYIETCIAAQEKWHMGWWGEIPSFQLRKRWPRGLLPKLSTLKLRTKQCVRQWLIRLWCFVKIQSSLQSHLQALPIIKGIAHPWLIRH